MEIYNEVLFSSLLRYLYSVSTLVVFVRTLCNFNFPFEFFTIPYGPLYFQVVNDLLNPAGQNLRIREDKQVCDSASDNLRGLIATLKYKASYFTAMSHCLQADLKLILLIIS